MLISLHYIVQKYNIQFKGVLHVGAHICEELHDYECYIPRNKILWIEALPDKVELNISTYPNILIEQAVVSDKVEIVTFNRSNNDQSSSILEFGLHAVFHPQVVYVDSFQVETKTLNTILSKYDIEFNFLNLDIQGVELKALKGMEEYLHKVDYIFTEVNSDYVYKDCGLVNEIDDYLKLFGLERVETEWVTDCRWGDAFYIRTTKV
jgi:FkbM family methyltransferase